MYFKRRVKMRWHSFKGFGLRVCRRLSTQTGVSISVCAAIVLDDCRCSHPEVSLATTYSASTSPAVDNVLGLLRVVLPADSIETDNLEQYGADLHSFHSGPGPQVVVFPSSTEHVCAVMRACSLHNLPVTCRAGGTSLEGHATTPFRGLVLDFSRMDKVLALRPADLDCTVQAGVGWEALNTELAPLGLFLPVDPGPGALVGGMVGTGASGTNAVRHLPMKAHVLNLTVVMADGTVIRTASRARKSVSGYDLTSLFVGSEGTLGVVTEVTLRLTHVPKVTKIAVVSFPDVASACNAVSTLMAAGVSGSIGAVELLDSSMMTAVNVQRGFAYPAVPHLFFKLTGSDAGVEDAGQALQRLSSLHGGGPVAVSQDKASADKLWEARKVALWSAAAMDPGRKICTTDVCVPLSALPQLMHLFEAFRATCASEPGTPDLRVYAVAHAGDGNAHHFISFDPSSDAESTQARRLNAYLVHTAIVLGGTCTGEHGVGVGKLGYLEQELGSGAVGMMRTIKAALDPKGILNPGKKVPQLNKNPGSSSLEHAQWHGLNAGCGCS